MSQGAVLIASFLAIFILGGPIASAIGYHKPLIGIIAGAVVYVLLSAFFGQNKSSR
ncbi:MAG: hypothetical protein GX139_09730 [Armatimonadetes bacterium]|jgi:hypothetical protein|nr:hypothetical protein [Armatimonadota bacterium]